MGPVTFTPAPISRGSSWEINLSRHRRQFAIPSVIGTQNSPENLLKPKGHRDTIL